MRRTWIPGAIGLVLAACGGGGGGGGGGSDPAGDVAAVVVDAAGVPDDLWIVDNTGTLARSVRGPVANASFAVGSGSVTWNPTRTRVAYVGDPSSSGSRHLLVADPALGTTTDLTPAAPSGRFISEVVWSSDGALLAFMADFDAAGVVDLYTVPAGGGGFLRVDAGIGPTNAAHDIGSFAWKPNAHRLAYSGDLDVDQQFDAYVVDADGTNLVRAARPGAAGADVRSELVWSDDGHRLAFGANLTSGSSQVFLYTVLDDGTGLVHVGPSTATFAVESFRWEPGASNRLAFAFGGTGPTDAFTLFRGNADTGAVTTVGPVGGPGNGNERFFQYAAGGRLVYQIQTAGPDSQTSLHLQSAAGFDQVLEDFPSDPSLFGVLDFLPSPDGKRIGYIFEGDPLRDSQDLVVQNVDGTGRHQVNAAFPLLPDGGYVYFWEWAPDSSRIAFSTRVYPDEPNDVFVVGAAGGSQVLISTEIADIKNLAWTSNSAFVLWTKDAFPAPDRVFLATADGAVTRELSTGFPPEANAVVPR